jgi:hypothetical protein
MIKSFLTQDLHLFLLLANFIVFHVPVEIGKDIFILR